MDVYDDQFYGYTRRLLASLGLWPSQSSRYRKVIWIFALSLYVHGIVFQYTTFITRQYNIQLFIELMSLNPLLFLYIIKHNAVYLNFANVKLLLEQINYDCIAITDSRELEIIQKYASKGKFYTIYSALFMYITTSMFIFSLCIPDILNFVAPLEEPRLRELPTPVDCFLDQQQFFYFIVSDFALIALIGMTTFIATETMFMMFILHACGLFAIASYRISHAFDDCTNKSIIHAKIVHAVKIHERSLQFMDFINSSFALSYLLLAIAGVISMTINMVRLFQAIELHISNDIFVSAMYVFTHFLYVFWVNYFGQILLDHSETVYEATYSARWYMAPLHSQKLLLFILQRSSKACNFSVFSGVVIASMDGFASIVSLAMSYFTVLHSMRS
ncbi:hypothetical protein DMN91_010271 [Ooceraea biroi]|uniref:Odorant receptor n=1 Tax=Ooceraea biroi TaxID=2015173 RepID=A0A3L8DDQ1_OOCBI|nr:uncharacterized protein LOC105286033 isoform X1 [Ooceraea biroi]RLU18029.1 hypothetical protein DMN91_010271 [Ooceraea biroi]